MPERTSYVPESQVGKNLPKQTKLVAELPEPSTAAYLHIQTLLNSDPPQVESLARIESEAAVVFLQNTGEIVHLPARSAQVRPQVDRDVVAKVKDALHSGYVIKSDEISPGYWDRQRRIFREQGHGNIDMRTREWREFKKQATEVIISDQSTSLNTWINYLLSPDGAAAYSPNAIIWVLSEIVTLSRFDRENRRFRSRQSDEGKTASFPELNPEALAIVIDVVTKYHQPNLEPEDVRTEIRQTKKRIKGLSRQSRIDSISGIERKTAEKEMIKAQEELDGHYTNEDMLLGFGVVFAAQVDEVEAPPKKKREMRKKRLDRRNEVYQFAREHNFAKLYAWAIEEAASAYSREGLETIEGIWKKYDQGSDPSPLIEALQSRGTGWCTAGESTAKLQLAKGDFYVYYSLDYRDEPTIPRAAIRMEGDEIAEIRGIAIDQNLDPHIIPVVEEKLREFPDGESYTRKVSDMRQLTEIDRKVYAREMLTASELAFLYELDRPIEGFGLGFYGEKDPRIEELTEKRSPEKDMLTIFGCEESEVARSAEEITETTKAYVGPLAPGIFSALRKYDIKHVYRWFPEGKIIFDTITVGGKSPSVLEDEILKSGMEIHYELRRRDEAPFNYTTLSEQEQIDVVRIQASHLAWDKRYWGPKLTLESLYERAQALGLTFCPAEAAMHHRLGLKDQRNDLNDRLHFIMPPEIDNFREGISTVLALYNVQGRLMLSDRHMYDEDTFFPRSQFIFQLPPPEKAEAA